MSIVRKCLIPILLALGLLLSAVPASAGGKGSTTTRRTIREPVTFEMTPAQCSDLVVTLYGKGRNFEVIDTTTYADGSVHIVDNSMKIGTAWDSTGRYRFVYHNHFVQDVAPGGTPIQNFMSDTFVLHGHGSARNLKSGFVWTWTGANFPLDGPVTNWRILATIGQGIACDPI